MIKTTAKVDGMMCCKCEAHVNDAIRDNFDVEKVSSSHQRGETIIISQSSIDQNKLADILGAIGHELLSVAEEPYEKKGFFGS